MQEKETTSASKRHQRSYHRWNMRTANKCEFCDGCFDASGERAGGNPFRAIRTFGSSDAWNGKPLGDPRIHQWSSSTWNIAKKQRINGAEWRSE